MLSSPCQLLCTYKGAEAAFCGSEDWTKDVCHGHTLMHREQLVADWQLLVVLALALALCCVFML